MASYIFYFIFIIIMTFTILKNVDGSKKNIISKEFLLSKQFIFSIITTIVGIIWGGINIYLFYNNKINANNNANNNNDQISKIIGIVIGISILAFSIWGVIRFNNKLADNMTNFGKTISIIIIFILMSALYKFLKAKYRTNDTKFDNLFNFIIEGIFIIPCFIDNIFDFIYRIFYYLFTNDGNVSFYNQHLHGEFSHQGILHAGIL